MRGRDSCDARPRLAIVSHKCSTCIYAAHLAPKKGKKQRGWAWALVVASLDIVSRPKPPRPLAAPVTQYTQQPFHRTPRDPGTGIRGTTCEQVLPWPRFLPPFKQCQAPQRHHNQQSQGWPPARPVPRARSQGLPAARSPAAAAGRGGSP